MSADTASKSKATYGEMLNSLTGFEEIAIKKHMDVDIYDVLLQKVLTHRLLIFVDLQRNGASAAEAATGARSMPAGEVIDYFADDPEEVDDDEPETPEGKEPSPSV